MRFLLLLAFLAFPAPVSAGDETCEPTPATPWHPAGTQGCTLDGPTEGKASTYPGEVAAAQWCVWPWQGCQAVTVQSHVTGVSILVQPAQFCHCWWQTDRRLIDLTRSQVRALGLDPRDGLFAVTVTPVEAGELGAPAPVVQSLPDTSMVTP